MSEQNALLTPFNELPSQARMLFFLYASTALIRYDAPRADQTKMTTLLAYIWKMNRFTMDDLSEPYGMTQRLKVYFASSACPQWAKMLVG
jgi:hypothetical protein